VCWNTERRVQPGRAPASPGPLRLALLCAAALAVINVGPALADPSPDASAPASAAVPDAPAPAAPSQTADSAATSGAPGANTAAAEPCNEPLCYTASSLQAERTRMVMQNINIVDTTRGITRIKADLAEASGEDLGNSEWVLTGHVQVFMPQGRLNAERATVHFVNKRIASMSAQGSPADFERSGSAGHGPINSAHGHARQIDYDLEQDLLKLNGDSWLSDGCNEINSQSIVYDIANQKVRAEAAPGADKQVQGTLHSRSGPQCTSAANRP
jgi:lipopolysaccharide transport protein LptA